MVKAKNRHNGVVSEFTEENWRKISEKNSRWHGVFELVSPPEVPKEVKELEEKQAKEKAETPEKPKQEVKAPVKPRTRKAPVKPRTRKAPKNNSAGDKKS